MEVRVREAIVWGAELEYFALSAQKNSRYIEHARFDALSISTFDRIRIGSTPTKYFSSRDLVLLNRLILKVSPSVAAAPTCGAVGSADPANTGVVYQLTASDSGATQYMHR